MDHRDFVVIGGGIAGASVAYELARRGRVALVEREPTLAYHTTGRSAALFTEAYEHGALRLLAMTSRQFLQAPLRQYRRHRGKGGGTPDESRGDRGARPLEASAGCDPRLPRVGARTGRAQGLGLMPILRQDRLSLSPRPSRLQPAHNRCAHALDSNPI